MFDNSKPNIIFLTDHTDPVFMQKCLGASKVAHELRLAGYEVLVINHLHIFSVDEIFKILEKTISDQTLFIGISNFFYKDLENAVKETNNAIYYPFCQPGTMLPHSNSLNQSFKEYIKYLNPECKLVLGGPNGTDAPWNKDFDYIVCGYGDLSIVNLANHLINGDPLKKAHKSLYGPMIINDAKAEGFDISAATMRYVPHDIILPGETLTIEISRGCIFNCAFCSYPLNGKKKLDFIREEEILYQEFLENYEKYQITRYIFSDDTFNDSIDKVQMIHRISQRLPFTLEYWAYIRLDLVAAHPITADLLIESGLRGCFFGIESMNKDTGEIIGKGAHKDRLVETLHYLKSKWKNKIMLHGSFIVGLPKETIESVTDTFNTLMREDCPLDSWIFVAYFLEDVSVKSNQFLSQISADPTKYNYRIKEKKKHLLIWENDHMDFNKASELADYFNYEGKLAGRLKLHGLASFNIASLGFDLEFSTNKKIIELDWFTVTERKKKRAIEYKTKLFEILDMQFKEITMYVPIPGEQIVKPTWGFWWKNKTLQEV